MATGLSAYVGYTRYTASDVETLPLAAGVDPAEFAARYGLTVVRVAAVDGGLDVTLTGAAGAMSRMIDEFWN